MTGPLSVPAPRANVPPLMETEPLTVLLLVSIDASEMLNVHRPPPSVRGTTPCQIPPTGNGDVRKPAGMLTVNRPFVYVWPLQRCPLNVAVIVVVVTLAERRRYFHSPDPYYRC